jgi:hypothetical protein
MFKTVNGKLYVKWGRVMTVVVWSFVFAFAHVLTWYKPESMSAYVEFLKVFFLGSAPLPVGIVVNSVVRSIVKKPTQYEKDLKAATAELDKDFPGVEE